MPDAAAPNFGAILFSPPVMIAGIAIGGILLLMTMKGHASGGSQPSGMPSDAVQEAQISATTSNNQAAMNTQVSLAQVAAGSGAATLNANVQSQGQILSFLSNIVNNNAQVTNTILTSQAGITNNQIAAQTALAMDAQNNSNRLSLAYVSASVAEGSQAAQVMTAQVQARAAQSIAQTQAIAGISQSLITGASKVVTAGF